MEENQKEIAKLLGLINTNNLINRNDKMPSWAEIYAEIGRLKEKAQNPQKEIVYMPSSNPLPLYNIDPNLHYHNGMPCRNNPCVWC